MIKTEDVVKFFKEVEGIELFEPQIRFLDNLIHAKHTKVSRGFGRTTIMNGYARYLIYICDKPKEYDDSISGEETVKMGLLSQEWVDEMKRSLNPKQFAEEYNIKCECSCDCCKE